ncbi:MAG: hypothetical protein H6713_39240 [Myxococcales bacterium]|nr:hypothetical protein [Myxococcales bacterium]MCB9755995.1 hypothetical protein [Myxococcales bacterium]
MSRALHETPYFRVEVTRHDGVDVLRVTRTEAPYPTLEIAEEQMRRLGQVVNQGARAETPALVDLRAARGRNDDGFERVMGAVQRTLFTRRARGAFLVRTVIGRMQVERQLRTLGEFGVRVFDDEDAALAYLTGGAA